MADYSPSIERLINEFEKLPSIGHKTAMRLALYMLNAPDDIAKDFVYAIEEAKKNLKFCSVCYNLSDSDPCNICSDEKRDRSIICVVEDIKDVMAMERINEFKGVYHVLHGVISPMNGIGPNDIKIKELLKRLEDSNIKEIIVATNPNVEGEATSVYLSRIIKPLGIKVTRIAHEVTLAKALEGRHEL